MEIRKFIIELHPDGKMTCCEYQEPAYYKGNMECAKVNTTSALEDDVCIRLIKEQFSMY